MEHGADRGADVEPFSEEVWVEVLKTVDRTYRELVEYQVELEQRNGELEGMRSFLTSILSAMSDILLVCGQEGHVLEVNQAYLTLSGREKEDVVGTPVAELFNDESADALRTDLGSLRAHRSAPTAERYLKVAEGQTPLDLSVAARFDSRDRYVGAVLIGRPTGELRRAYADLEDSHLELQQAQSQLVHSEKLASLGRLLAGVAHELNNPISFVYGNAHALERYATKFESYFQKVEEGASRAELIELRSELKLDRAVTQMRSAVTGALEGSERVRDIVESLRRLSAEGSGQIERFDLVELCHAAVRWVTTGAASPMDVAFEGEDTLVASGRPGHIQQVLMNLVQNAMDAVSDRDDPRILVSFSYQGGLATVSVSDNGPGVPDAEKSKVFDPFFTTKPVGQGTGLGLSISYKIVQENGGDLTIADSDSGGALFRLTLPRDAGADGEVDP